jgi:hypothetical protein
MDHQTGTDRNRDDLNQQDLGRPGNVGQQQGDATGTSGRDADLQTEGNLGNERNRNTRDDEDEDSGMGNRHGQNR